MIEVGFQCNSHDDHDYRPDKNERALNRIVSNKDTRENLYMKRVKILQH